MLPKGRIGAEFYDPTLRSRLEAWSESPLVTRFFLRDWLALWAEGWINWISLSLLQTFPKEWRAGVSDGGRANSFEKETLRKRSACRSTNCSVLNSDHLFFSVVPRPNQKRTLLSFVNATGYNLLCDRGGKIQSRTRVAALMKLSREAKKFMKSANVRNLKGKILS